MASSTSNQTNKAKNKTTNIVITTVVIILLLLGISFIVIGIIRNSSGSDTREGNTLGGEFTEQNTDENSEGNQESSEETATKVDGGSGEAKEDSNPDSNLRANLDSNLDTNLDSTEIPQRISKYQATNYSYSRGNDYSFGDITGEKYTLVKGDTLWQIAEGRYGSGHAWKDINYANGGFPLLLDGTPVHLRPGDQIILPEIK